MINHIDFLTPIVFDDPDTIEQDIGNFIEDSLYLCGRKVHVISSRYSTYEMYNTYETDPLIIALKVAAYVLTAGIFPLVMLIAKILYRSTLPDSLSVYNSNSSPGSIGSYERPGKQLTDLDKVKQMAEIFKRKGNISSGSRVKVKMGAIKYIISTTPSNTIKIQEIVRKLGRGGFGKAYDLLDIDTQQHTALKIAKPSRHYKHNREALKSAEDDIQHEFDNLQLLNSPTEAVGIQSSPLSPILEIKKWDPIYKRFQETRKGYEGVKYDGSLDKLNVHHLDVKQRFNIIYQIVKGVQHFRQKGLVHNDLKPQNIFYKIRGNRVKASISDFGSAWSIKDNKTNFAYTPGYATDTDISNLTSSRTDHGKHWSGKKLDIYSLGKTLFELLTGNLKYNENDSTLEQKMVAAGLKGKKYENFIAILKRMLRDSDGYITDNVCKFVGIQYGRPEINEVVEAVRECLN